MALNEDELSAAAFMLMAVTQYAKREIAAFLLNKATKDDLFDLCEYLECAVDTVMSKSIYQDEFEDTWWRAPIFFLENQNNVTDRFRRANTRGMKP